MIKAGKTISLKLPFREAPDDDNYRDGSEFDCAQIDFQPEHRVRVYAICESPSVEPTTYLA